MKSSLQLTLISCALAVASGCSEQSSPKTASSGSGDGAGRSARTGQGAVTPTQSSIFKDLRQGALEHRLPSGEKRLLDGDVDGLIVDWGLGPGEEAATIVCMNDGSASMYVSSGGGIIGAGGHESVRSLIAPLLQEAVAVRRLFQKIEVVPPPKAGTMRFTLITREGFLSVEETVEELSAGRGPLAVLGNAVQQFITAINEVPENDGGRS